MIVPEKVKTAILPTPIDSLDRMTAQVGKARLYMKRDDLTGLAFGGNKLRKLDYIVKYALDNGYTTIMTHGGQQTNHGRLTAAACAKYGLKCIIVVSGTVPEKMSGNLVIDKILGAEIVFLQTQELLAEIKDLTRAEQIRIYMEFKNKCVAKVVQRYESMGEKVYDLPIGGHTTLGTLGYCDCVKEIMEQLETMKLKLDYLVVGNGSGGTLAGVLLGAKFYKAPFKIIAANIAAKTPEDMQHLVDHVNQTAREFDMGVEISLDEFIWNNDHVGVGYNIPDDITRQVIYRLARTEGILLDPTYTGKSFAAFLAMVEDETIPKDAVAMFLHTGGTPALFTEAHLDMINEELWKDLTVFPYTKQ